jgi:hypothetical protein
MSTRWLLVVSEPDHLSVDDVARRLMRPVPIRSCPSGEPLVHREPVQDWPGDGARLLADWRQRFPGHRIRVVDAARTRGVAVGPPSDLDLAGQASLATGGGR